MDHSETLLTLGQFIITLRAESHNPTILNPDFLKNHGIVLEDWELADDPVCVRQFSRVAYKSGVTIVAEFDDLVFAETVEPGTPKTIHVPEIAASYVGLIPHVNYRTVVNNPVADMEVRPAERETFVRERFVREGPWMMFKGAPPKVEIEFRYAIDNGVFTLSIQDAVRRRPDSTDVPVVLYDGAFSRQLTEKPSAGQAASFIRLWESDLTVFSDFVRKALCPEGRI